MKVLLALLAASLSVAAPAPLSTTAELHTRATVTVAASAGDLVGVSNLLTGTENFNGIPFASPPVGNLRLRPPQRLTASLGRFDATGLAAACPQFTASNSSNDLLSSVISLLTDTPLFQRAIDVSEDCLTVNVIRPRGSKAGDKLPVLFWIFGGGFSLGWSGMYDGSSLVKQAAEMGKPYIFVAVNYRVGGFGFLPGKEILRDGAANIGLLDQRMALEWTADNVAAFGGDPDKVTIWGESAGAISVMDQMALYDGDHTYKGRPLFRAGIMNSGSLAPADAVDCPKGQAVYDRVAAAAGCAAAQDTLACLRAAPYETFLAATHSVPGLFSYSSLALSYLPRPDGRTLRASPEVLLAAGRLADVPIIIGNQEDEGTFFALLQPNVTTAAKLVSYLGKLYFPNAGTDRLAALVATYDPRASAGSPYRTGLLNQLYPGFKRTASLMGDLFFTLSRRVLLEDLKRVRPGTRAWSYMSSYDYGTPLLGTFHGSDLPQIFYGLLPNWASRNFRAYYANFVYNLDPNDASGGGGRGGDSSVALAWPEWGDGRMLLHARADRGSLLADDFRRGSYESIRQNAAFLHI